MAMILEKEADGQLHTCTLLFKMYTRRTFMGNNPPRTGKKNKEPEER